VSLPVDAAVVAAVSFDVVVLVVVAVLVVVVVLVVAVLVVFAAAFVVGVSVLEPPTTVTAVEVDDVPGAWQLRRRFIFPDAGCLSVSSIG